MLVRKMDVITQKTGEKIIGKETEELENVMNEQKVECISNIVANSLDFFMYPQKNKNINIEALISNLICHIEDAVEKNVLIKLMSQNPEDVKSIYALFEDKENGVLVNNIDENIGVLLAPYEQEIKNKTLRDLIINKLMLPENLKKMNIKSCFN